MDNKKNVCFAIVNTGPQMVGGSSVEYVGDWFGSSGAGASAGAAGGGGAAASGAASVMPYVGAGLGALNAVNTYLQASKIADTQGYKDYYDQFGSQLYDGDFNALVNQRKNSYLTAAPSWRKIRGMSSSQKMQSHISSTASGAMAGAGFGLPGVAIGAGVGLLASLFGTAAGDAEAKDEAERLKVRRQQALADNQAAFVTGIKNATSVANHQAMANLTAFGGPLDGVDPSTPIGYSLYTDRYLKERQKDNNIVSPFAGVPSTMFNLGGVMQTNGANWGNLTHIDAGGQHENNPNDGVQIGTDNQGVPNLVEEDEVIYNDYVFSNRLVVPRGKRGNYGKRNKYAEGGKMNKGGSKESIMERYEDKALKPFEGLTFADAAKKAEKLSGVNERPNDPIAQRGLESMLVVLAGVQEKEREKEKLKEQQEAIDQMTPEEFAMLQQQMEAQKAAEEQAALQQQQMIPQGMQQMVPQEQMAAAFGGPIYGLGGLLDNWDNTPVQQEPNIFEDGGFKEWWSKYISEPYLAMLESDDANSKYDANYGALYKVITGEEGPTDSQEVYNALQKIYQQDRSKFKPYDFKTNTFIEENPTGETQILTTEEGSQTIPTVEGPLTEVLAHANLSAEDWSKLSEKQQDRYIKQYKSSLKKDDRVNFQERLDKYNQQQEYNRQIEEYRTAQRNSNLTQEDLSGLTYDQKVKLGRAMDPNFDASKYKTLNERDNLDADLVKLSKDNNVTLGQLNENLAPSTMHKDWQIVNPEEAWNTTTTYDWNNPIYGGAHDVVAGNTEGRYQPRDWKNEEGKIVVGDKTYKNMKDYETSDEYLLPRYELAKSAAAQDEEGQKLWNSYIASLNPNYAASYNPSIVFGENYANSLQDYDAFKKYITDNYSTLNTGDNRSGFFDQIPGQMHGMIPENQQQARELYQMKGNEGTYLTPEGNWRDYYSIVNTTDDGKGTKIYTLDPNAGIVFNRANGLPQGVELNPDGTYKGAPLNTENDPFPKAANWPYLVGLGLQGAALGYNLLTPADYSNADALISAAKDAGQYNPIGFRPVGNYLKPRSFDKLFYANQLAAQSAATRRAIRDSSNRNRATLIGGLLGADKNALDALGNMYRQAEEFQLKADETTEGFNKDTNKFNSEGFLKADMANQETAARARGYQLEGMKSGYAMRQAIDDAKANAISAGISGIGSLLYNWADSDYKNKLIGWGIKHGAYAPQKVSKGGKVRRRKGLSF